MNTIAINVRNTEYLSMHDVPDTGRGRALYTIDWFLNGHVRHNSHDSLQVTVTDVSASQRHTISTAV